MNMIFAVMYREFRIRTTSMTWLFYDMFMPLAYLLIFGIGLNSAFATGIEIEGGRLGYNAFFLAGVLSMASFGIAINTAYGFFVDRDNGIFFEFLTYPMSRAEFLIGKILFNSLLALVQAALTVVAAALMLDVPVLWSLIPVVALAQVLGTAAWFFFLSTFAIRIRRNDMFNTFLNIAYFILMFGSSMFYPTETLPGWLRVVSYANPLTWHTDILRFATVGAGAPHVLLMEAGGFLIFLCASFLFAVQTIRNPLRA